MTKKEAVRIALQHLLNFVDSADIWNDADYEDYVQALSAFGIQKGCTTVISSMVKL